MQTKQEREEKKICFALHKKEYSKKIIALMSPYFFSRNFFFFSWDLKQFLLVIFEHFDLNCDGNSLNVKCFHAMSRNEYNLVERKKKVTNEHNFRNQVHTLF